MATIDHVTLRASDIDASVALYERSFDLLGFSGKPFEDDGFHEWNDFSVAPVEPDRPGTRNLHIGFAAASREQVETWWLELTRAGYWDAGAPGVRAEYRADYYGAFVLDPDGNSVEAVVHESTTPEAGTIDHVWVRVRDLGATRRFYERVLPAVGVRLAERPGRLAALAAGGSFSFVEGTPTENLHLAIGVGDQETVRAFHAAGLAAGGIDEGEPGERPRYHPGYYGAYLRDPDDNNIEAVFHER